MWCCRWKRERRVLHSHSFPAPSASLDTHTHRVRWNLSVALGVFALFRSSPPELGGAREVGTRMPSCWSQGSLLLLLPVYLLSFVPSSS